MHQNTDTSEKWPANKKCVEIYVYEANMHLKQGANALGTYDHRGK